MTTSEARAEIYDYVSTNKIESPYKDLSKLLKKYGRIASCEVLGQLKTRLSQAIEIGEDSIKKNDINSVAYGHQLVVLKSIMKWTDGQLKMLSKDASASQ
jgi:hypothetical protein